MKLKHQVSLITGAGAGIGRATAVQFAKEGAQVVALDWNTESVETTRSLIEQAGGICQAMTVDVSQEQQVKDEIATTVEIFGHLDILFNNAGISILKPITETTEAEWDRVLVSILKACSSAANMQSLKWCSRVAASLSTQHPNWRSRLNPYTALTVPLKVVFWR